MENVAQKNEKSIPGAIKIDEKEVFDHLDTLVRQSVEETINSLLDAEADVICNANRYQRSPDRWNWPEYVSLQDRYGYRSKTHSG